MPVRLPVPPVESKNALGNALDAARASTSTFGATAGPAHTWLPHQVYEVFIQDLAAGKPIDSSAREAGWRYLLPQGSGVMSADVQVDVRGRHGVSHFALGPQAVQTLTLTQQVVADPRFADDDYELRLLLIRGLYVLALWLHDADPNRDWFVPTVVGDGRLPTGEYLNAAGFNETVTTMAIERLRQGTPDA